MLRRYIKFKIITVFSSTSFSVTITLTRTQMMLSVWYLQAFRVRCALLLFTDVKVQLVDNVSGADLHTWGTTVFK